MDAEAFNTWFEQNPTSSSSETPEEPQFKERGLTVHQSQWSRYFRDTLSRRLSSSPDQQIDLDLFDTNMELYASPANKQQLLQTVKAVRGVAAQYSSLAPHLNDLNFHTITEELIPYWKRLLAPDVYEAPSFFDITAMQIRLGVKALEIVEARTSLDQGPRDTSVRESIEQRSIESAMAGQTTEIEAVMAELEVIKEAGEDARQSLAVVASPVGYDRGGNTASSDSLLINLEKNTVIGTQVKTRLTANNSRYYDKERVILIDGVEDLGNATIHQGHQGAQFKKAQPGLLAADFILNLPGLQRANQYAKDYDIQDIFGPILHARQFAATLAPRTGAVTRIGQAAANIQPRIFEALEWEAEQ